MQLKNEQAGLLKRNGRLLGDRPQRTTGRRSGDFSTGNPSLVSGRFSLLDPVSGGSSPNPACPNRGATLFDELIDSPGITEHNPVIDIPDAKVFRIPNVAHQRLPDIRFIRLPCPRHLGVQLFD